MTDNLTIQPARIQVFYLRAPIDTPVKNSFAAMTARPAVLIRIEEIDGAHGWGEIWCNHPPFTGGHRLRLAADIMAPRVIGERFENPSAASASLPVISLSIRSSKNK